MVDGKLEKWFDVDRISSELSSTIFKEQIHIYGEVDSTNSIARDLAKEGKPEGTVILAQTQKEGHGRLKRRWESPEGGLWFSMILRPEIVASEATKITLMAGLAIAETLRNNYQINALVKWPNDVLIHGKKVCGMMTEMRTKGPDIDHIILGIGINVNFQVSDLPKDLRTKTTTLKEELKRELNLEELLLHVLKSISYYYEILKQDGSRTILNKWKGSSDTLGRRVRIELEQESIEGMAQDLDENGALILKTDSGDSQKIFAGDCIHLVVSEGKE
jgi:BirA family biotin operon repressor/biotin-[acetyl-CoA-carboxylase] ligase